MSDRLLVLVADDQPHILLILEYLVRSVGQVDVATACNGEEAVSIALRRRPALVLMDVMMPLIDGYTACRMIREGWGDHPGQIWFITARGSHSDVEQAREVGAQRCLNKPFDPDQIVRLVREALAGAAPAAAAGGNG